MRRPSAGLIALLLLCGAATGSRAGQRRATWPVPGDRGGAGAHASPADRNVLPAGPDGGVRLDWLDALAPSGEPVPFRAEAELFEAPALAANAGAGEYLALWRSLAPGTGNDILAARLDAAGARLGEVRPLSAGPGSQLRPRAAHASSGGYLAVWEDGRGGRSRIFSRRLADTGAPAGEERALSVGASACASPDVAWSGTHLGYLAVWLAGPPRRAEVSARRVTAEGAASGPEIVVSAGSGALENPRVAASPAGGWLVLWTDRSRGNADIRGLRLAPDGRPAGSEFTLRGEPHDEVLTALAAGGPGFLAVWDDHRRVRRAVFPTVQQLYGDVDAEASVDVAALLLDTEGRPAGGEIPVGRDRGSQQFGAAAWSLAGERFLAVWQDARGSRRAGDVYGVEVRPGGGLGTEIDLGVAPGRQLFPQVACAGAGGCLALWWSYVASAGTERSTLVARPLLLVPGAAGTLAGFRVDAGVPGPRWGALSWEGEAPAGTLLGARVRTAATAGELEAAPWGPLRTNPGGEATATRGRWLEIEARLESREGATSPVLRSLTVEYDDSPDTP